MKTGETYKSKLQLFSKQEVFNMPNELSGFINKENIQKRLISKGLNKKNVLVIVSHSIDDLTSTDNALVLNILKALKLNLDDVALVEFNNQPIKYLWRVFKTEKCLIFGLNPKQLNLHINSPVYKILQISSKEVLFSHSAQMLNNHKKNKELLWRTLQRMFTLS